MPSLQNAQILQMDWCRRELQTPIWSQILSFAKGFRFRTKGAILSEDMHNVLEMAFLEDNRVLLQQSLGDSQSQNLPKIC